MGTNSRPSKPVGDIALSVVTLKDKYLIPNGNRLLCQFSPLRQKQSVPLLTANVTYCGVSDSQARDLWDQSPIRDTAPASQTVIRECWSANKVRQIGTLNTGVGDSWGKENELQFMDATVIVSHISHRIMASPPSWSDNRNAYAGNNNDSNISSFQNQSRCPQKEVIDRTKYIIKARPIDTVNSTSLWSDGEYADTLKYRLRLKEAWKKSFLLNLYGTDEKVKWNRRLEKLDNPIRHTTAIGLSSPGKLMENTSSKITPRQKFEMLHNRVSRKVTTHLRHPNIEEDKKQSSAHTTLDSSNSQNKALADSTKSFYKESPRAKFERHRAARSHVVNVTSSHSHTEANKTFCGGNLSRTDNINNGNRVYEMVATSCLDSGDASISPTATSKLFINKKKVDYCNNMNGQSGVKTSPKEIESSNGLHDISLPPKASDINLVPPKQTYNIVSNNNNTFIVNVDITDKPCPTTPSNTAVEQRKINLDSDGPVPRYGSSANSSWGREGESDSFHVTHVSKETRLASPHASVSRSNNIDIASPHSCGTSSSDQINFSPIACSTRIVNDSQVFCSSNHKALGCCDKRCCDTCDKEGRSIHVGKCHFSSDNINTNNVTSQDFVANNGIDRCRCVSSRCEKCSQKKTSFEIPRRVRNSTTLISSGSGSVSSSGYESEHTVSRIKQPPKGEIRNKINGYHTGVTPTSILQELRFRFNQPICVSKDNSQLPTTYSVKSNTFNQHVSSGLESRSPGNPYDVKYNSSTSIPHVNSRGTKENFHQFVHTDVNNNHQYKNNHCDSSNRANKSYSQQNCGVSTQPGISNREQEARDEHHNWPDASVSYPTICGQGHHRINSCRQRETSTYSPFSSSLDIRDILSHRNISIHQEATMLASKGLRIYEDSNECLPQDRQVTSSLVQTVPVPKVSWKAASYLIVPTVIESRNNIARRNSRTRDKSHSSVFDVLTHRSISDSGTSVIQDVLSKEEMNNGVHSDGDVCSDDEYNSMSRVDHSSNMRARAMSVDLICKEDASDIHQDTSKGKVTTRIKRKDRRQSRGYVEWNMTCSGWIGDVGKKNSMKRNSRGYVEWDTIWTPAVAFKGDDINDEHVYDVINDEQSELLIQEQAKAETITMVADSKECDAPPALPERTYINRLKQVDTTAENRHRKHSPRCHHHQRQSNHHRHHHHHHHNNHHRHHRRHSHSPSGHRCQGGSSPSSSNNASSKLKSSNRPSHGDHHQPPPLPLAPPPPPLPPPNPIHQSSDNSQNYAQVHKLKGYTFGNLMTSQESAHEHQPSDKSAVYSENYCHLQPISSEERMTLWKSGDVLNYIDGLHESMSPKSRENIYILLNNKKTRAKFSESLEIESRLLSKGLLSASVSKMDIDATTSGLNDTHNLNKVQKGEAGVKKRPKAPVSSTYV